MALAQRRLGLKNKFLENNQIRPHFFAFDRFTLQILANKSRGVYTNLLYFLYITSEVKQDYLSYRPRTECSISQFFKKNCTQSIFWTINPGLLAKPFKKNSKITHTASRFSLLVRAVSVVECLNEL